LHVKKKLTKRIIDKAEPQDQRYVIWDTETPGFGVRVNRDGSKTFVLKYFSLGKQEWLSFGKFGGLTVEQARKEAMKSLGDKARGQDPAKMRRQTRAEAAATAISLKDFCEVYLEDARQGLVTYRGRPKMASTLAVDEGRIRRHIVPILGRKLVRDITLDDVSSFMHSVRLGKTATTIKTGPRGVARVRGGTTAANRAVGLLGSIMTYAVRQKLRDANPVRGIEKPIDGRRERSISPEEYQRLGTALDELLKSGANPSAICASRVIALTGCRRSEVFGLRKTEVDAHHSCIRFDSTKSGQQLRPIGRAAFEVLVEVPILADSEHVFPAARGNGHLVDVKVFHRACEMADLPDLTLHGLRHGYASVAGELGYSDATIGVLLGHRSNTISGRYTHIPAPAAVTAASRVAATIAQRMKGEAPGADVVPLGRGTRGN
jgi:integrase